MKLIIGLGNPGRKYEKTRHNVGFMVVDELLSKIRNPKSEIRNNSRVSNFQFQTQTKLHCEILKYGDVILAKPTTFMNESGTVVKKLVDFYKPRDLFVIYDDLDIKLGEYKILKGRGPHDHNGLESIYKKLGRKDFWHVRIGIENRKSLSILGFTIKKRIAGEDYVLQSFSPNEQEAIDKVIGNLVDDLIELIQ